MFDIIQNIVYEEYGVLMSDLYSSLDKKLIFQNLSDILGIPITESTTLLEMEQRLYSINEQDKGLNNIINESALYEKIRASQELEHILGYSLALLILLKRRYSSIAPEIINSARIKDNTIIMDKLKINVFLEYLNANNKKTLSEIIEYIFKITVERHLCESSVRMMGGTRNWLFVEEDNRLFFAKNDTVNIYSRDNKWDSVLSLLIDIGMIKKDQRIGLTDKGTKWLQQAKLI